MYTAKGHQRKAHDFAASVIVFFIFLPRKYFFSPEENKKRFPTSKRREAWYTSNTYLI
jgi:hypothetical protein